MDMQSLTTLKNMVRVGKVSSVNTEERTARVAFEDKVCEDGRALMSGELKVLNEGVPDIGKFVLCLFLPNGSGDGFVLGAIFENKEA